MTGAIAGGSIRRHLWVDLHAEPVVELRRIYNAVVVRMAQIEREYGAERVRLFGRVKY